MGGFIILEDGRACAPSNAGYDLYMEEIAACLKESDPEFAAWLLDTRSDIRGMGMGCVDVRELTPARRAAFRTAVMCAAARARTRYEGQEDPWIRSWLDGFEELRKMWESIDRGEPPSALNDLVCAIEPSGKREGPGWDELPL